MESIIKYNTPPAKVKIGATISNPNSNPHPLPISNIQIESVTNHQ